MNDPKKPLIVMLLDNPFKSDARVEKEALVLMEVGYEVKIYAVRDDALPESETTKFGTVIRKIDPIIDRPLSGKYKKFFNALTAELIALKPTVLHCHDHNMLPIGSKVKSANPETYLIYDAHEYLKGWPLYLDIPSFWNRLKGRVIWHHMVKLEHQSIKKADTVITVSQSIADEMKTVHDLSTTPVVLRNIPPKFKSERGDYFHQQFGIEKTHKVLIHLGNLYYNDDRIKMLYEAIEQLEGISLVFIGNTSRHKELRKRSAQNIFFQDYLQRDKLYNVLGSADFGLVHTWRPDWKSHWFSLPNRIMEYSMAGLPVISTAQPEFVRLIQQFDHGVLYQGDDVNSLISAINRASLEHETLAKNAEQCYENLNWETESRKLVTIYTQAIA